MPSFPPLPLNTCSVLLVEDDPVNQVVLSGLLGADGYKLDTAGSGEEALAKCEVRMPELIVLDIRLPGMDGLQTCRELQRRFGTDAAPVVFVTARNSPEDVVEGFAAGGVDYLVKPVSEGEARARVRTHLSNRLLLRQLEEALSHKNRLLGMAAHDLRNPLSTIRGMAELLGEGALGPLKPDQEEVVSMVRDASNDMLTLVNELLDVTVIESGQLKLNLAPIDFTALTARRVHFNNINAARKNTSILFAAAKEPVLTSLDSAKMAQVIDNLLTNAVKYSPPGSNISVALHDDGLRIRLAVRDQGPGIPEQERSKLFKEFGTLSVRSTGGEKSTGLGLAICRRIVEAHAGMIDAQNLAGGGCEFSVILPATR